MNKGIKTIGLLGILLTMVIGVRFMANQSDDSISSKPYAEQEVKKSSDKEETTTTGNRDSGSSDAGSRSRQSDKIITNTNEKYDFSNVDKFARTTKAQHETDISVLANHLNTVCENDLEKARAIFIWLTENIRYDDDAYNSDRPGALLASDVLEKRKAVCEGFSNLFVALGDEIELPVKKVTGYSRGVSFQPGVPLTEPDHAWNIVKIDGEWSVFDATWGEGNGEILNGKLKSKKDFNEYWFNVDPYEAIFNHYPEETEYAFIEPVLSLSDYQNLPVVRSAYFKLGFSGKETLELVLEDPDYQFPLCYDFNASVEVIEAPRQKVLELGEIYEFVFRSKSAKSMALIRSESDWNPFEKEGRIFSLSYLADEIGSLSINLQTPSSGNSYEGIMEYEIVNTQDIL